MAIKTSSELEEDVTKLCEALKVKISDGLASKLMVGEINHAVFTASPDLKELNSTDSAEKNFSKLMKYSGFPEPFFENSNSFHLKWQKSHMDLIQNDQSIGDHKTQR